MGLDRRIERLEQKTRFNEKPTVAVIVMPGEDEEQKIQQELERKGYKRNKCRLIIIQIHAGRGDSHDHQAAH